ncbi:MAG: DNA polymerase III subunit gamma/tau [Proteobacteria bacterium]|nr:DNA polymerase III subunit gamma/tau [Pseudomonadota bacterium]
MSYLVLARKLRPPRFKDLVGQESIWKTLINAIASDRVAHAFLFTGPRGTGKTSCARILTKALNCKSPVDNEPCNQCENCTEINQGISTDVVEIDAASNRGIEHIRELRENVKFSPAKCQYKTYIIDEVHMLTTESFNALLKTLEEPPAHVKFILATTDHHKIPTTVISRCQRYDFANIPTHTMVEYLKKVAASESIQISDSALHLVARSATGGLRDALTTLDMLVGFDGEQVGDDKVVEVLGLNDAREVDGLLKHIIDKDLSTVLSLFQKLVEKGRSITRLVTDLMGAVKDLSLVKMLAADKIQWHDFLPDQLELYQELSKKTTASTLQQFFHILLEVEAQIKRSTQARICVEMGLIKMCSIESLAGVAEVISVLRDAAQQKKKSVSQARYQTQS